jgi:hypothetical protein
LRFHGSEVEQVRQQQFTQFGVLDAAGTPAHAEHGRYVRISQCFTQRASPTIPVAPSRMIRIDRTQSIPRR